MKDYASMEMYRIMAMEADPSLDEPGDWHFWVGAGLDVRLYLSTM
jgi:hypothetical protein